jgi:murein DD-endopeptidase MepM/ murein hydrolase activator NlpD
MLAIEFAETFGASTSTALGAASPQFIQPVDVKPQGGWAAKRGPTGKIAHQALDFPVRVGTPVRAAASGFATVSRDKNKTAGNWIRIEHDGPWTGFMTRYMHLSKRLVKEGAYVEAGQVIAKSGNTGLSAGPHLHFDMGAKGEALKWIRPVVGKRVGREFGGYRLIPSELFIDFVTPEEVAAQVSTAKLMTWQYYSSFFV